LSWVELSWSVSQLCRYKRGFTRLARPSVCPVRAPNSKPKQLRKIKICINVLQGTSKWIDSFQVKRSEVKIMGHQKPPQQSGVMFTYGRLMKERSLLRRQMQLGVAGKGHAARSNWKDGRMLVHSDLRFDSIHLTNRFGFPKNRSVRYDHNKLVGVCMQSLSTLTVCTLNTGIMHLVLFRNSVRIDGLPQLTPKYQYQYHLYCYQFISLLYRRAFAVAQLSV